VSADRRIVRIAAFMAAGLFLQACGSQPAGRQAAENCPLPRNLYVVGHGKHTGVVVRRIDLVALLPSLAADIGRDGYVEIGWGEERYYQAGTGTVSLALRAAFWPNTSVLQLVAFQGPPGSHFTQAEVVELPLDEAGYRAALTFVADTFTRTADGAPVRLGPALYGEGWFYRAEGSFHLFNNCNNWVAKAVESSGVPGSSVPAITASGLLARVRESALPCKP
jgi:uncharacterized protein (TIGR02117 family)